ncbi:MAG: serine/threonine-protein kinase [Polyangiaceae bacterium]
MKHLGPFVVERELGRGGSGVVFAARREGEPIALKVAHDAGEEEVRRFLAEARHLSKTAHPALIEVLDAGELPDGRAYLAMPLLEGETLAARLSRGPLERGVALELFAELAAGVEALHAAGLVHRDIKAENVFLVAGEPTRAVLLDLGIAKDTAAASSTTTQRGVIRGTPATMAPERHFGQPASIASDVYELGLLLYLMLVGRAPWTDESDVDERLSALPPNEVDPSVPRALGTVVMQALSTRPARRPASARALADAVAEAARETIEPRTTRAIELRPSSSSVSSPPPNEPRATPFATAAADKHPSPPARARTILWVAAGTIAGALAVYVATGRDHPATPNAAAPSAAATSSSSASVELVATVVPSAPIEEPAMAASIDLSQSTSASAPAAPASASAKLVGSASATVAAAMGPLGWCQKLVARACDPKRFAVLGHQADWDCKTERDELALWEKSPDEDKPGIDQLCKKSYDSYANGTADKPVGSAQPAQSAATFPWSACKTYMQMACSPERVATKRGAGYCEGAKRTLAMRPDPTLDADRNRAAFSNNERFCSEAVEYFQTHKD